MNIEFKILWIDDQWSEGAEGFKDNLERYLEDDQGFRCNVVQKDGATKEEVSSLADDLEVYNDYNLILLDMNLKMKSPSSLDGQDLAKELRKKIATDMILYSSDGPDNLRKKLYDEKVDAVSIINRDHFDADIKPFIDRLIRRSFDMDNLRGFVLQHVAEIEVELRRRLTKDVLPGLDESGLNSLVKSLKIKMLKASDGLKEKADSIDDSISCYSDYNITNLNSVRTRLAKLTKLEFLKDEKIVNQLQTERNDLAHQPSELDKASGRLVLQSKNRGEIAFNYTEFLRLRRLCLLIRDELSI